MKSIKILSISALFFVACEDITSNNQSAPIIDMIPPTVSISSPLDSQTVSGVQSIIISAQDNNKIHDVSLHILSPTSNEFYEIERWNNTSSSSSVSYSYDWDTSLEIDGNYNIKVIVNDHDVYHTSGNAGTEKEVGVMVYNYVYTGGGSGGGWSGGGCGGRCE
ncbi:MAG: hypothetical protein FI675_05435 [SAR202 cluster bacterium]|nr:hypothetical protein [SAR202 cluster bacterium]|tara:strand:- start:77 stop:565 length:489 start_codon:yes stop_codon:yes gene_type:complete